MRGFLNRDLGDLAHQLTLSPRRLRAEQLAGIHRLVGAVEPDKTYPFEFVCYHITGYQKRGPATSSSIPGNVLLEDLATFAETLSRKAQLGVGELSEPYWSQEEVADHLQVSTKTVRRWRVRGLVGLRAVHEDGVNRLVFLRSTVERFVARNRTVVRKGASFTKLSDAERVGIVERAREIVAQRPVKLHAVARQIAEETQRAVETIRYTLRRHDARHPGAEIFAGRDQRLGSPREQKIWACREAGDSVAAIAKAFDTTPAGIEAVLRAVQVRAWQHEPPHYVANELFDAPQAEALIIEVAEPTGDGAGSPAVPRDLPPYLQALYRTPLLTTEQEQDLFRRYNYVKFKAARLVAGLEPEEVAADEIDAVQALLSQADALKQRLVQANLRLVVSIAKKHVGLGPNFFEVVSDGNLTLMRAVDNFDFARGNKFSTYACWSLIKNYARSIPEAHYHCHRYVTGQDELLAAAPDTSEVEPHASDVAEVRAALASALENLPDRERQIITGHFGLFAQSEPLTLDQLGQRFGVTKERIRQLERKALTQLRELLSPDVAQALRD